MSSKQENKYVVSIRNDNGWDYIWFCSGLFGTGVEPEKCFVSDFRLAGVFGTKDEADMYAKYAPINVRDRVRVLTLDEAKRNLTYRGIHKISSYDSLNELKDITVVRNGLINHILPALLSASRASVSVALDGTLPEMVYDEKMVDLAIKYANETAKKIVEDPYWYNDTFNYAPDPLPREQIAEAVKNAKENV
jgi:hypothetical protein